MRFFFQSALLTLLLTACGKPDRDVRHFLELNQIADEAQPAAPESVKAPAGGAMPALPPEMQAPSLPLAWETPEGWENLGASGMRIAAFRVQGQECTILSFPGDVGGDEANLRRWLGQLNQSVSADQLSAFASRPERISTAGGFEARLFDVAELLPAEASSGILAAVIPIGDHTAFVKLSGPLDMLAAQKESFRGLCRSISLRPEEP